MISADIFIKKSIKGFYNNTEWLKHLNIASNAYKLTRIELKNIKLSAGFFVSGWDLNSVREKNIKKTMRANVSLRNEYGWSPVIRH